jgi:hypothetical protein
MTRSSSRAFAVALLLALAAGAGAPGTFAVEPARVWVYVTGPIDWQPDPGFRLEVAGEAWIVNSAKDRGAASVDATGPVLVRLVRLADCTEVVRFTANPNTEWLIVVRADGTVEIIDRTGQGTEPYPLDSAGPQDVCLPETSTRPDPAFIRSEPDGTAVVGLALVVLANLLVLGYLFRIRRVAA